MNIRRLMGRVGVGLGLALGVVLGLSSGTAVAQGQGAARHVAQRYDWQACPVY